MCINNEKMMDLLKFLDAHKKSQIFLFSFHFLNMDENIAILSFVAFIRLVLSYRAEHVGFMWSRWNITGHVPIWNSKRKIFPFILKEKKPSLFSISVLSLKPLYQVLTLKGQKHKRLQKPCFREPEEVWREVCFIWWRRTCWVIISQDDITESQSALSSAFLLRLLQKAWAQGPRGHLASHKTLYRTAWPLLRSASFCFEIWSPAIK